ncbi:MAG: shikimate kinase [Candidatus Obscuribacterales bacterium]
MQTVILIGPPGSGKSTCGALLAQKLGWTFTDIDDLIAETAGMTVAEIFARQGEGSFRKMESQMVDRLLGDKPTKSPYILSTGGGLPIFGNNMDKLLALGVVVYLAARLDILEGRVETGESRPLLAVSSPEGAETPPSDKSATYRRLEQLLEERAPVYERARYKIDTSDLSAQEVVNKIALLLS